MTNPLRRHHTGRAWRLITAKVTADPAERALNREVGEGTRDWSELAHALADIVCGEIEAHQEEGRMSDDLRPWLEVMCDDDRREWLFRMVAGDESAA